MLPEELQKVIDGIPVVIATHQFGNPCRIEEIQSLCRRTGCDLIESCAASLGTHIKASPRDRSEIMPSSASFHQISNRPRGGFIIAREAAETERLATYIFKNIGHRCQLPYQTYSDRFDLPATEKQIPVQRISFPDHAVPIGYAGRITQAGSAFQRLLSTQNGRMAGLHSSSPNRKPGQAHPSPQRDISPIRQFYARNARFTQTGFQRQSVLHPICHRVENKASFYRRCLTRGLTWHSVSVTLLPRFYSCKTDRRNGSGPPIITI